MFLPGRYGPQGKVDNIPWTRIMGKTQALWLCSASRDRGSHGFLDDDGWIALPLPALRAEAGLRPVPRAALALRPPHGGHSILHDGIRDCTGEIALVSRICNQPGLVRVTHEAALKKDCWMLHTSKDAETCAPDTPVRPPGLNQAGAVNSGRESDVGQVLCVSISELKIILA